MSSTRVKTGHFLAKCLGIKLEYRNELPEDPDRPGQSLYSVQTAESFVEEIPTSGEWIREQLPSGKQLADYLISLFPFTKWILHYNMQWLAGDLVAGITIGAVVVPQGMAYAKLANLPVEYGLYSSFMGVLIYWFFATSKDITIGPVAVMSTLVGEIVTSPAAVASGIPKPVIASCLAVVAGGIICAIGLIRCGWIVDLIPLVSICAFMTGSAISIAAGQVPSLMGISKRLDTHADTYLVIVHTLRNLRYSTVDAAMGLTALLMLYMIRSGCKYAAKKFPSRSRTFFFASTMRTVFVILLYTLISYLVNRGDPKHPVFKILGHVPRGFQDAGVPTVNAEIIKLFATSLPSTVIVLLIEHIAISKSFGRVNNYVIDPSQEMVAIGITNMLGPFLGAYPATGSFSRTAIKSKAGVRTPLAGVITAVIVLLAIYALTAVFFYISSASLSAVIIHAVGDLITSPNTLYQFWRVSPLEVFIFFIGVLVTVFASIEDGIYTTVAMSAAILLFRVIKAKGRFLGMVKVHSVLGDHVLGGNDPRGETPGAEYGTFDETSNAVHARSIFLPIDHRDGSNPEVEVSNPYPGVFIYRFSEGFNYPNANHYLDHLTSTIFKSTRRTNPSSYARPGDRPWNDPGPRHGKAVDTTEDLPTLKAIILDFSSVNNIDTTAVQQLIDVRNQMDRYASPETVDWHFACINNRWTKRGLVSAGFGYPTSADASDPAIHRWKPIFSVAEIGGSDSAASAAEALVNEKALHTQRSRKVTEPSAEHQGDAIAHHGDSSSSSMAEDGKVGGMLFPLRGDGNRIATVHGLNRPLFHIDLTSALQSAITNVEARQAVEDKGGAEVGKLP